MARFNLEDYEQVEDRIKRFYKEFPDGRITTKVLKYKAGEYVLVKASIFKDSGEQQHNNPLSTGIADEYKGKGGPVNMTSWTENCETSAIGRALANHTFASKKKPRPSREEMGKVEKEDPVTSAFGDNIESDSEKISEAQSKLLHVMLGKKKTDVAAKIRKRIKKKFGVKSIKDLKKSDASKVLDGLMKQ